MVFFARIQQLYIFPFLQNPLILLLNRFKKSYIYKETSLHNLTDHSLLFSKKEDMLLSSFLLQVLFQYLLIQ